MTQSTPSRLEALLEQFADALRIEVVLCQEVLA